MKKLFITTIFICLLFSCKKPLANFKEPQPANTKDLASFPNKTIGTYHNYETNTDLVIDHHTVLLTNHFTDTLNKTTLLELQKEVKLETIPLNDSLFIAKYSTTDTVFSIGKTGILRKLKGHYFLNSINAESNWEVKKLTYKNNMVSISDIYDEESIQKLDEITETVSDSIRPKTYTLTKKQFKEFVVKNGFTTESTFIRQK